MARWKRPQLFGMTMCVVTEVAPADSPKMVTLQFRANQTIDSAVLNHSNLH